MKCQRFVGMGLKNRTEGQRAGRRAPRRPTMAALQESLPCLGLMV